MILDTPCLRNINYHKNVSNRQKDLDICRYILSEESFDYISSIFQVITTMNCRRAQKQQAPLHIHLFNGSIGKYKLTRPVKMSISSIGSAIDKGFQTLPSSRLAADVPPSFCLTIS